MGPEKKGARRRARYVLGFAALGCAAVIWSGWDTASYLYHRRSLRADPEMLCAALFGDDGTPLGRAARDQMRAHAWEATFSRVVAGKSWRMLAIEKEGSPHAFTVERTLRAEPDGAHYRLRRHLRHSRLSQELHSKEVSGIARVWGPFLIDVGDSGRVGTWGLLGEKLILAAVVRITHRDWVLFQGGTSFKGVNYHVLLRFSFDRDLEPGAQGLCRFLDTHGSEAPVIRVENPKVDFDGGREVYYVVAQEPGAGPGRVVVVAMNPPFRLHLDTNLGIGWHEYWSSFVYEEDRAAVAKP